jgi:response regulator RpfG family c-di-GMP phosphodiesterase
MKAPKKDIPIIALTASVLRADLDLCFESGMTAYVPKPFKPWQLVNTIAEVTGRERNAGNTGNAGSTRQQQLKQQKTESAARQEAAAVNDALEQGDKVTNLAYLTEFCEGDEKRMKKYIKVYLNALPAFHKNIDAAIANKDFVELALHVHSFKPKWMMMGMKQTNEKGVQIDHMCKSQNEKAFDDIKVLMLDIDKSKEELEAVA